MAQRPDIELIVAAVNAVTGTINATPASSG
jgi:hypothetical protein